ncbi:toprim domain-containing protein [Conexibacter sp. DBS9H8]|uniref:toprim domain-containing protein n=1 Tax=Conexibacter sp. DBS9H8 TaxID=2937801 RepID=UPI00200E7633|nr:toprim domain-containing protein [Conexibacter sp. DBS9H8]
MAGGDVRGFYAALGIELPGWAQTEAPVRCFVDPDAHSRQDHNPSCSVSLDSGAFNCHSCGAGGGAYDAAVARHRTPRAAMDLLVAFGLADRRPPGLSARPARRAPSRPLARHPAPTPALAIAADHVQAWAERLQRSSALIRRLERERGWSRRALVDLEVGFDGERITVPIWCAGEAGRSGHRRAELQGLLRLRVDGSQQPKVIAARASRLGLMPLPAWTRERRVLLVEGPSDLLAACSAGLPAIAVPGANAWRPEWACQLDGRTVVVAMDCDRAGRQAAARIIGDLERRGIAAAIHDLAPARDDGYDLSDWLREGNPATRLLGSPQAPPASVHRRLPAQGRTAHPTRSSALEHPTATTAKKQACRPF